MVQFIVIVCYYFLSIIVFVYSENNTISVWNNGKGIPVAIHKDENMYVPTMIFGHLLTSSNYDDEEEKVTGGRNGYGAKLCNIFSHRFTVETASKEYKKSLKQVRLVRLKCIPGSVKKKKSSKLSNFIVSSAK